MKKSFFLSAAALILAAGIHAQTVAVAKDVIKDDKKQESAIRKEKKKERKELRKLKGNTVSEKSQEQFFIDFGRIAGAQWKRTGYFDEVTFTRNGKTMTAFYDDASNLVGTIRASSFARLPAKAQNVINKEYKDYVPGDVVFFDDNEANGTDMLLYGIQFDDVDSYFVSLKKGNKTVVVQVSPNGEVGYFSGTVKN